MRAGIFAQGAAGRFARRKFRRRGAASIDSGAVNRIADGAQRGAATELKIGNTRAPARVRLAPERILLLYYSIAAG
jgi:hypothetical protein